MTGHAEKAYLPAAGKDWALPLYDPFVKLTGGDAARRTLLEQAAISPGDRILDIGCGTGTMVVLIKRLYPGADVVGIDPDPKALARAEKKVARARVSVRLDRGFSDQLPYADASFDRVLSSLMFHHIDANDREATLRDVRRVLKPGGSFHMMDLSTSDHSHHGLDHLLHSSHELKDNSDSRILALMKQAGFAESKKVSDGKMLFGLLRVGYFQGLSTS